MARNMKNRGKKPKKVVGKGPKDNIPQEEEGEKEQGQKGTSLLGIATWSVILVTLLVILLPSLKQ